MKRLHALAARFLGLIMAGFMAGAAARAAECDSLKQAHIPETVFQSIELIPAGDYTTSDKVIRHNMPRFCRVMALVNKTPDSQIVIELWLPTDNWKGVFHGNGNGGYGGILSIGYNPMEAGLKRGYATAITDMGTAPSTPLNGDALIDHPQKWKDWGRLSTHIMTITAKAITRAFYGQDPRRAYFTGCSTGGQQGLIEAQYYPDDYDGILIGAPVVNRTWGHAAAVWNFRAANLEPGHVLSLQKLNLLAEAALAACGGLGSGLKADAFIADPSLCRFDPGQLACAHDPAETCFTQAEIETARAFYSGPLSRKGKPLYFPWMPGSEAGFNWAFIEGLGNPRHEPAFDSLFKWVFGPNWDWRTFELESDMQRVDAQLGPVLNDAVTGSFARFATRGGKIIFYQGWADPLVAPNQTLALYQKATRQSRGFARLYMAPGVAHCGGGLGPNSFNSMAYDGLRSPLKTPQGDIFAALVEWVEDNKTPSQLTATKYIDDKSESGVLMQRPLCPFPQKAWYKGSGDSHDAASFVCRAGGV